MSLPVETVIVVVLAIIVLVALLFFFSGTFLPGSDRIKLEQRKVDLCTKYVSQDSECRASPSSDLQDVCKKLDSQNVRVCCSAYCPPIDTSSKCTAAGGSCLAAVDGKGCDSDAAKTLGFKSQIGTCSDDSDRPFCCTK